MESLADDEKVYDSCLFWDFLVARETKTGKEKNGKIILTLQKSGKSGKSGKHGKLIKIRRFGKIEKNFKNEIGDSDWWIIVGYSWNTYFIWLLSAKNKKEWLK